MPLELGHSPASGVSVANYHRELLGYTPSPPPTIPSPRKIFVVILPLVRGRWSCVVVPAVRLYITV